MKKNTELKELVKQRYSELALNSNSSELSCCCGTNPSTSFKKEYTIMSEDYSHLKGYVSDADLGVGCGLPTQYARIKKGDTVIDVNRNFAIINLNGKYLDFDGVIADDRTLVPVREITEGLGGEVLWDEENLSARIFIDGREIIFTIESDNMMVNAESVLLDVPAKLINGKTMVPLRKLAEVLGAVVDWDGSMKCVYIEK